MPGTGYVRIDGIREPSRVRAGYVTNDDIAAMVRDYAPPRPGLDGEQLFKAAEHDVDGEVIELPTPREAEPEGNDRRQAS